MEKILKYSQTWALLSKVDDLATEECKTEETLESYTSQNSQQINLYLVWLYINGTSANEATTYLSPVAEHAKTQNSSQLQNFHTHFQTWSKLPLPNAPPKKQPH